MEFVKISLGLIHQSFTPSNVCTIYTVCLLYGTAQSQLDSYVPACSQWVQHLRVIFVAPIMSMWVPNGMLPVCQAKPACNVCVYFKISILAVNYQAY